jgi:hypothetical protein
MIDYNILIIIKEVKKIAITNKLMIKCFETQFLLKMPITVYFTLSCYLGIIIDQHLKWDIHVNNLIIKMRKLNYFYINARKILDKETLLIIYFALTQSLLQYGIQLGLAQVQ